MSDQKPLNLEESVDIALKPHNGRVIMLFPRPVPHVVFKPESAFNVAEELARCAHRAKFPGERMPEDFSYLAQQVRARLTEDLRDRLVVRVGTMLPSLLESKNLVYISKAIVDTIFSAVDDQSHTKLEPRGGLKI